MISHRGHSGALDNSRFSRNLTRIDCHHPPPHQMVARHFKLDGLKCVALAVIFVWSVKAGWHVTPVKSFDDSSWIG